MTADHLGAIPANGDLLLPGYTFGLGFAVRKGAGLAPQSGSAGQYFWSGVAGTSFFVDPAEDLFAMLLTQAPSRRIYTRNLFRSLVYAALD
jgi:CubicO group peptidase (beta-lactamase class C family)